MRITVRVKPNSVKQNIKVGNNEYRVSLNSPPLEGKANEELIEILADYFNTSKSKVKIISGHKSKIKVVEIKMEG
ncbi:MAG: DUF167 domain-containing protein [bacterium]|nr:DUF167 domain-containing protein [bacterium]